jgi:hypothetical protein
MPQVVNGSMYRVRYTNTDQSSSAYVTFAGDSYSPETVWTLAQGLVPAVKEVWFSPSDTVRVAGIESTGDTTEVPDPVS